MIRLIWIEFGKIWNYDLKGVIFGVTQFATQCTPVDTQCKASSRKQKLS